MKSHLVSNHAEQKRFERGISWEEIPDPKTISKNGIHKVVKSTGNQELVAVYGVSSDVVVLKTVYRRQK